MKKVFLAIAAVVLSATTAMAQSPAGTAFIKPMVGGTLSTLTKVRESKMRVGFVGGAEFGYQTTDQFAVTAGVLASMQGVKTEEKGLIDWGPFGPLGVKEPSISMTYINVPIMANYYVAPGLAIKAGVQLGFLVSQKTKNKTTLGDVENSDSEGFKKFDFTIPLGLSYEFSDFVIDARYNLGLTKVFDNGKCKNSVIMLTIGYKIPL